MIFLCANYNFYSDLDETENYCTSTEECDRMLVSEQTDVRPTLSCYENSCIFITPEGIKVAYAFKSNVFTILKFF